MHIFYHVAAMGPYQEIVQEQIALMIKSQLLKDPMMITIGYVSDDQNSEPLIKNLPCKCVGKVMDYEFPTLGLMWDWCKEHPEEHVLYIHTKGASKMTARNSWREYLNWGCIEQWERCVNALKEGYDGAGVEYTEGAELTRHAGIKCFEYWVGNFFWAKASYLATLPDPRKLNVSNRWEAEGWFGMVGSRMPVVKSFHDTRKMFNGRRGWQCPGWNRSHYVNCPPQLNEDSLDKIAIQEDTDKSSKYHDYCVKYERLFGDLKYSNISLLEIGVHKGASLRMWRKYFQCAKISGIDINKPEMLTPNIDMFIGNATDAELISRVAKNGPFDIIIDDGSHIAKDFITSFSFLFGEHLKPGGFYVIEDMAVCQKRHEKTYPNAAATPWFSNLILGLLYNEVSLFREIVIFNEMIVLIKK